jgi:hypothetical protein
MVAGLAAIVLDRIDEEEAASVGGSPQRCIQNGERGASAPWFTVRYL